jgi:hypothetical protein
MTLPVSSLVVGFFGKAVVAGHDRSFRTEYDLFPVLALMFRRSGTVRGPEP